jgi:hypothetical protein
VLEQQTKSRGGKLGLASSLTRFDTFASARSGLELPTTHVSDVQMTKVSARAFVNKKAFNNVVFGRFMFSLTKIFAAAAMQPMLRPLSLVLATLLLSVAEHTVVAKREYGIFTGFQWEHPLTRALP